MRMNLRITSRKYRAHGFRQGQTHQLHGFIRKEAQWPLSWVLFLKRIILIPSRCQPTPLLYQPTNLPLSILIRISSIFHYTRVQATIVWELIVPTLLFMDGVRQ